MSRRSNRFRSSPPSRLGWIAAIALTVCSAPSAFAQGQGGDAPGRSQWGVGFGAMAAKKPYRNVDQDVLALPIVAYENRWIDVALPTLDFKLFDGDAVSFRLRASYQGDGYEASDSPFLAGMDERKSSVWVGGAMSWNTDIANVSVEVLADAMDESGGTRARLQVDRRFASGKFGFTPRLAAEWVDDKYVDYYYGVRQSEVTLDRSAYTGRATTEMQVGLRVDYSPARQHTLFLDLSAGRFGRAVKDSPLVDKPEQTSLGLGYLYRF